ncbi:hypothetical protein DXG01_007265 [Tephrocybe rancida]|nr:hypothetical protein DXG01_007265 [Tephrocybe rancida]
MRVFQEQELRYLFQFRLVSLVKVIAALEEVYGNMQEEDEDEDEDEENTSLDEDDEEEDKDKDKDKDEDEEDKEREIQKEEEEDEEEEDEEEEDEEEEDEDEIIAKTSQKRTSKKKGTPSLTKLLQTTHFESSP